MPKRLYTIRDWSGGMNNRRDPRDLSDNEFSYIINMSIDSLGKLKTVGGLYSNLADSDGDTSSSPLTQYIVNRTAGISGAGGYGLFYFESDHSGSSEQVLTDSSIGTSNGNISFVQVKSTTDTPANDPLLPI
jgi:hypothetical protein